MPQRWLRSRNAHRIRRPAKRKRQASQEMSELEMLCLRDTVSKHRFTFQLELFPILSEVAGLLAEQHKRFVQGR